MTRRLPRVAVLVFGLALLACNGEAASEPPTAASSDGLSGELVVFAAASLTDAFDDLAAAFEDAHGAVEVTLNLAGSQTLASQVLAGASADVFASADDTQLDRVADAGMVATRTPFAVNHLAVAVEPGNPLGIASLADLARDDAVLVMAAEDVPAGRYAAQALAAADVQAAPASLEVDVLAALGKVVLGEADAAIVYASDVVAADDTVEAVEIGEAYDVAASYPVARLVDAPNVEAAEAFVTFLGSELARDVLRRHGFEVP